MKIQHVLSTNQFLDRILLETLFQTADELGEAERQRQVPPKLRDRILATIFYEPSTRTRLSFESAMLRLGGEVISTENARDFSSAIKGETIEDTVRVVQGYADALVLRHYERGAADRAAAVARVPIINAGDGHGEHPTQALLDFYTIRSELGRMDNFEIALVGDLRFGRTVHSLLNLLSVGNRVRVHLVSPDQLPLPAEYAQAARDLGIKTEEHRKLDTILPTIDILYMTRIQKERFATVEEYEAAKGCFVLKKEDLEQMKPSAKILHPLPRVNELPQELDQDPRAAYFRQAKNGLYIRMALLHTILNGKTST